MKKITLLILFAFCFSMKAKCVTYTLIVTVYGTPSNPYEFNSMGYTIDLQPMEYNLCGPTPSIHIAIIDSNTCNPVNNCNKDFGQYNVFNDPDGNCINDESTIHTCRPRAENYFIYHDNDAAAIQHMVHLLDSIENGNIIIAYSVWPFAYSTIDTSFRNVFQRLGSAIIPTMPDNVPFIFVCKKGDASTVHEIAGTAPDSMITLNMTYECSPTGTNDMNTGVFKVYPNPVNNELHIDFENQESGNGEVLIYDVFGNIVSERKNIDGNFILNTENLPAGFYFVRLESDTHFSTVKFCKVQ